MNSRRRLAASALALTGALLIAPALSGCSIGDVVNGAVSGATGGKVAVRTGKLPSDWPAEVPVVDGEVVFGAKGGDDSGKGWIVTIKAKGGDGLADAKAKLEAAGFTADSAIEAGGDATAGIVAMKNDDYAVLVTGGDDGLVYAVTPVGDPQ